MGNIINSQDKVYFICEQTGRNNEYVFILLAVLLCLSSTILNFFLVIPITLKLNRAGAVESYRHRISTMDHENEKARLETVHVSSIENNSIKYTEDSINQFRENEEKVTDRMHDLLDESRRDDTYDNGYTETFDSKVFNPSGSFSYGKRLRERLDFKPNTNDTEFTEETHLKLVYDPACEPDTGLQSFQSLEGNEYDTGTTEVDKTPAKSRIVTSAYRSELHKLPRNFFDSKYHYIRPHELLNRTFGMPLLVMEICRAPLYTSDSEDRLSMDDSSCPILINLEDEACIISYFCSRGFLFHCRTDNRFYFSVGNRGWGDVNAEINKMEDELRMLCFGRVFGRYVAGSKIDKPTDLVITFHNGRFEHSSWRFYYLMFENDKAVVVRHSGYTQSLKLKYIYSLFSLLYGLVCLNKVSFRKSL